jgi:hypothetical protein
LGVWHFELNVTDATGAVVTSNAAAITVNSGIRATSGVVGITGYKLVFEETLNNTLTVPATVDYYWSFSVDRWNGTQWVATAISGSSTPASYTINALTTVDLPYYVYRLNMSGPNAVAWNEWLNVSFTFHSTYSSTTYSNRYTAELNVHPADITGAASVAFPYLGADGVVNIKDAALVGAYWGLSVPSGTDPTSDLARADIGDYGVVNIKDAAIAGAEWGNTWTNTPPTGTDPSAVTMNGSISGATSLTHQCHLTVTTNLGTGGPASAWLDAGSNVTIQAADPQAVAGGLVPEGTPILWHVRFKVGCGEV